MNGTESDPFSDEGEELDLKAFDKIRAEKLKEGYREGISAGKEAQLQKSFESGYQIGFTTSKKVGQLGGIVKALICSQQLSSSGTLEIDEATLKSLSAIEEKLRHLQDTLKAKLMEAANEKCESEIFHPSNVTALDHELSTYINTRVNGELESVTNECRLILHNLNLNPSILN